MSIAVQSVAKWSFDGGSERLSPEDFSRRDRVPRPGSNFSFDSDTTQQSDQSTEETPVRSDADAVSRLERNSNRKKLRRDKLAFVLGVLHFWLCVYWLGSDPQTFYKLYTVEAFILFPLRWKSFKKMKMHYYMFDFCYLANLLLLVFLWAAPKSAFLFKVLFAYNSGPLAWAIVLFKNSMVYHNLSEVTTLFMHWYPMLVSWTLRWYPDCPLHDICTPSQSAAWFDASTVDLLLWPMVPYIGWAIFYYLKLFVVSSKRIRDRGYQTLYKYMLEEETFVLLRRIVFRFSPTWRPLVYMIVHLSLVFLSLLGCVVWWNSFWAHSTWLAIATISSAWNGAAYYFA